MTREELSNELETQRNILARWEAENLTLDLTRGKPNQAQLDLSSGMLNIVSDRGDCFSEQGLDCRNYGILDGLPETKKLFADLLGVPESRKHMAWYLHDIRGAAAARAAVMQASRIDDYREIFEKLLENEAHD